ncbi:hypothetical protein Vretifemale_2942 [Volvox reticuliferus]|uniref:2-dehydropantoate 2-reductase n=1 Tax=Volvox reticuliferus TaxID=1737510 RepID=A0A8J4BZU3_9CHLO|nr:hypothetical protein Vretifemale_2942 [Volvox reticuliferus]
MASSQVWHILGGGSLGLLCAFHLQTAGFAVNLILRSSSAVAAFKQNGSCVGLFESWRKDSVPSWRRSPPLQATSIPCLEKTASDNNRNVSCGESPPKGLGTTRIHRLILATKAQDTVPALRNLLPYMDPGCRCILLQNGVLAVAEELQQTLGEQLGWPTSRQGLHPQGRATTCADVAGSKGDAAGKMRLYVASVTHGCYKEAPPHQDIQHAGPTAALSDRLALGLVHAGFGSITVGVLGPLLASAAALAFTEQPFFTHSPPCRRDMAAVHGDDMAFLQDLAAGVPSLNIRPEADPIVLLHGLLAKLAANCAINPLTVLLGCCNGTLTELPHTRGIMLDICRELIAIFGPTPFSPLGSTSGGRELVPLNHPTTPEKALYDWVLAVAVATAKNRSSMLQDIVAGRPTELDYLSGWVLRAAAARGLQAPVNATLHALVKARERLE